jgi:hypothetical protein
MLNTQTGKPSVLAELLLQLCVRDKATASLVPLDLEAPFAWAQRAVVETIERQIAERRPVRVQVLKARQLGMSTVCAAVDLVLGFLWPGINAVVIAHQASTTASLYDRLREMYATWELAPMFTPRYSSQHRFAIMETGTSFHTATAGNVNVGRGHTLHVVHGSEVAYWPDPQKLVAGLMNTVPSTPRSAVILESTAAGVGGFWYDSWRDACEGESEFEPLFFPAYHHPEYRMETDLTWEDLDKEEREILERYGAPPTGEEQDPWLSWRTPEFRRTLKWADMEFIAWRRWAITNRCNGEVLVFNQEYPLTPEEAFVSTGDNVFRIEWLQRCYQPMQPYRCRLVETADPERPMEMVPDPYGPYYVYKAPARGAQYFVALDPSVKGGLDPACAQVINVRTREQVAVWRAKVDAVAAAHAAMRLAKFYNWATISSEVDGPGGIAMTEIMREYRGPKWKHKHLDRFPNSRTPPYGWLSNFQRKHSAIELLAFYLSNGMMIIHDRHTFEELASYVYLPGGVLGPADPAGHDDAVDALAQAVICAHLDGMFGSTVVSEVMDKEELTVARIKALEDEELLSYVRTLTQKFREKVGSERVA